MIPMIKTTIVDLTEVYYIVITYFITLIFITSTLIS